MFTENIGYILQIITIAITLGLGLINSHQTKKLQHGQNIISVTTNYRMKRCEQLKECGQILLSNTTPALLSLNKNNSDMLKEAYKAAETMSMIMHRYFVYDRELIELASDIAELAILFDSNSDDKSIYLKLEYKRKTFRIKCDIYTTADWSRIKSETEGVNSSASDWEKYYLKIADSFKDELDRIKTDYEKSLSLLTVTSNDRL